MSVSLTGGVLEEVVEVDVEDAGGVLGPLDVATDPKEALGDAAQHAGPSDAVARRLCCCCCCCCCCLLGGCRRPAPAGPASGWPSRRGPDLPLTGRIRARTSRVGAGRRTGDRDEHPGVLGPAALAGVDHQAAVGERHPGQAAGDHPDLAAVVDGEGTEVEVAGGEPVAGAGRSGRQLHHLLGDPRRGSASTAGRACSSSSSLAWGPMRMP